MIGVECRRLPPHPVLGAWRQPSENPRVWQMVSEGLCPQHPREDAPRLFRSVLWPEWAGCPRCSLYWRLAPATVAAT